MLEQNNTVMKIGAGPYNSVNNCTWPVARCELDPIQFNEAGRRESHASVTPPIVVNSYCIKHTPLLIPTPTATEGVWYIQYLVQTPST